MSVAVRAVNFPRYIFPLENAKQYIADHENVSIEPCIASNIQMINELTPILNGTNEVKNSFLTICEFKVERDGKEHIYYNCKIGYRVDVTALFRVGKFYLADQA